MRPDYFTTKNGSKNNILTQKGTRKNNNDSPYVSEYIYEYTYADNNYPLTQKIFQKTTENGVEKKELGEIVEYTY